MFAECNNIAKSYIGFALRIMMAMIVVLGTLYAICSVVDGNTIGLILTGMASFFLSWFSFSEGKDAFDKNDKFGAGGDTIFGVAFLFFGVLVFIASFC